MQLSEKSMVKGLPQMSLPKEMCKECLKGKQPRNSFKSSITARSTYLLYVVHIYGCMNCFSMHARCFSSHKAII